MSINIFYKSIQFNKIILFYYFLFLSTNISRINKEASLCLVHPFNPKISLMIMRIIRLNRIWASSILFGIVITHFITFKPFVIKYLSADMLKSPVLIRKMWDWILKISHSSNKVIIILFSEPLFEEMVSHSWRALGVNCCDVVPKGHEMGSAVVS